MPRPGPRPYECIRRAWHGDSHHTLRGTLIQEIFRVANEIHCSTTRRKKEWQEKLPTVVLRAEEILYSKANSEEEYMDLKTLCSRVNDAINTMIRRDESTESGNLLEPCVEAALSLGCRKGTRGRRHNSRSCGGSSRRPTTPTLVSSLPVIGKTRNYGCPSFVKLQIKEARLRGNDFYSTEVKPTHHFADSKQHKFISIPTPVFSAGSFVSTPNVHKFPFHNESSFFYPGLYKRSHKTSLHFNQGGVRSEALPGIIQGGGGLMRLPEVESKKGMICVPFCSTSTSNALSTAWSVPRPQLFDASSITLSSCADTIRSSAPFVYPQPDSQVQVPSLTSKMACLPQADLDLQEGKNSIYSPCKTNKRDDAGAAAMNEITSESTLNTYDLQLRLGPPRNNCSTEVAVSGSYYVHHAPTVLDLELQIEGHPMRNSKASDKHKLDLSFLHIKPC